MHNNSYKSNNANSSSNKLSSSSSMNSAANNGDTAITRMHPSMKRPRAPIACYRCHHKKVRCDGVHPNCTRCLSTGVLCAYPSSRRSRNTQPTNVDPFIDNLSQLEARIRRIETDLESQRTLVRTVCAATTSTPSLIESNNNALNSRMLKTEKDLQESRSIVAQLRLRGEQRAARGRRAAAAAQAASTVSTPPAGSDKNNGLSGKSNIKDAGQRTAHKRSSNKLRVNSNTKKDHVLIKSPYSTAANTTASATTTPIDYSTNGGMTSPSPPFYFTQSDSSSPVDFINPSPTYYFPTYQTTTDTPSPICNNNSGASFMMSDWPLLNDLPHTTTANSFVDPMILAAAEQLAPPILSVSSYLVDEETSIMAARARSLSHLPAQQQLITIPGLQPSTSSTSTCSNNSGSFSNYMYDTGATSQSFTQFLESAAAASCGGGNNDSNGNSAAMIMIDQ